MWAGLKRIFAVSLMVLLVASSSLSAFSFFSKGEGRKKDLEIQEEVRQESLLQEAPEELQEEQLLKENQEEASEALQLPTLSAAGSETKSTELSSLLDRLENQRRMDKEQLTSLIGVLTEIKSDYEIVVADAEEKQQIIDELADANAKQADDLAYLRGRYDKEVSSKFFMNMGMALGVRGKTPIYGITGNFGVRIGKGFLIGAGVQCMAGSFTEVPFSNWSLDDLSVQMTIGWEW